MLYRNTKTGATVSVTSPVCGDWEPVERQVPDKPAAEPEPEKKAPVKRTSRKKK